MSNVVKAVFVEMFENIGAEYNDEILSVLVEAYYVADKHAPAIKLMDPDMVSFISNNYLEEYYDLDYILEVDYSVYNDLKAIERVARVYKEDCMGVEIEMLKLEDFFANSFKDIVKNI